MQLKTYCAKTSSEALAQIKAELGSEAIILETKEENGKVTITAALERQPHSKGTLSGQDSLGFGHTKSAYNAWQDEWQDIKGHLLALMKPSLRLDLLAPRQKLALEYLQKEGVDDGALLELYQSMHKDANMSILSSLNSLVPIRPWNRKTWPERVHFMVGPFGAGKSSTTLRLALLLRQSDPTLRICLINADAARGNGRLFLRHYAELSDLSYKEAADSKDLSTILLSTAKEAYDLIFVDMSGIQNGGTLQKLFALSAIKPEEKSIFETSWRDAAAVHLVLPPHCGEAHMQLLLSRYKTLFRTSLIYTKLDEAESFGQIINVGHTTGLPISALSFGPGLGNSLIPASEAPLWRLIFKRELPKKVA